MRWIVCPSRLAGVERSLGGWRALIAEARDWKMNQTQRVLVVEANAEQRKRLCDEFRKRLDNADVVEADNRDKALRIVVHCRPDVLVLDLDLPDALGIDLLKDVKALHPGITVLAVTAADSSNYAQLVYRCGASTMLRKSTCCLNRVLADAAAACLLWMAAAVLEPERGQRHRYPARSSRSSVRRGAEARRVYH